MHAGFKRRLGQSILLIAPEGIEMGQYKGLRINRLSLNRTRRN